MTRNSSSGPVFGYGCGRRGRALLIRILDWILGYLTEPRTLWVVCRLLSGSRKLCSGGLCLHTAVYYCITLHCAVLSFTISFYILSYLHRHLSGPKSERSKPKAFQAEAGHPMDVSTHTRVKLESTGFDRGGKEQTIINHQHRMYLLICTVAGQKDKNTSLISSHENPQNPRAKSRRSCGELKVSPAETSPHRQPPQDKSLSMGCGCLQIHACLRTYLPAYHPSMHACMAHIHAFVA